MTLNEVVKQLSKETGLTEDEVIKTYKAFWMSIRSRLKDLDLIDNPDSVSFNIPELGKLYCEKEIIIKYKKRWKCTKQELLKKDMN